LKRTRSIREKNLRYFEMNSATGGHNGSSSKWKRKV
jgi:hypothetical protein